MYVAFLQAVVANGLTGAFLEPTCRACLLQVMGSLVQAGATSPDVVLRKVTLLPSVPRA